MLRILTIIKYGRGKVVSDVSTHNHVEDTHNKVLNDKCCLRCTNTLLYIFPHQIENDHTAL